MCLSFGLVSCGSGTDAAAQQCADREAALGVQVSECQVALKNANEERDSCQASLKTLGDKNVQIQSRLDAVEKENAELKQTPAAVSQEILASADTADTIAEIDAVLASIAGFADRFPGAPEIRVVSKRAPALKKARVALVAEEERARAMQAIAEIRSLLENAEDGDELSLVQIILVANHLAKNDLKFSAISQLPRTDFGEAMKDADSERGKAMVVSGSVIQIAKDGEYFTGLICGGSYCSRVYHFVTPGTTRGINQGSYVTFAGVFVQRYSYSNSGGGTTHSLALVGYFKNQD